MNKTPVDMQKGVIHETKNYGKLEIVKYNSTKDVYVRFLDTGTECKSNSLVIRRGQSKDRFKPTVYGVGYIGGRDLSSKEKGKSGVAYKCWQRMLERCYSIRFHEKRPTYIGCTVCNEWHNFQSYLEWHNKNYIEGCQLDKDIKIKGNKEYSPSACSFVTIKENSSYARSKTYKLINPSGEEVSITNLLKFCNKNELDYMSMHKLANKSIDCYLEWRV